MRGLIGAAVVAVAVVLQLAVADRIAFPGGTGPDLVLLTIAALALATGPMTGAVLGFCAGLALDVAPPAGHLVGQDALVFCLIGYVCGLAAAGPGAEGLPEQERSALFELGLTAAGAVCGEAMIAGLGVMLSDPRMTWPAIKHVLPVAAGYDVLLSPFVLFTVAAMLRVAGFVRSPRLRLSNQGKSSDGWVGGGRGGSAGNRSGPGRSGLGRPGNTRPGAGRREPRLKLGGSGKAHGHGSGRRGPTGLGSGSARVRFGGRRREGVVGGSLLGTGGSGRAVGFRRAGDKLASSRFGASLLGGSVFSRSSSPFGRSMSPFGRSSSGFSGSGSLTGRGGLSGRVGPGNSGFTGRSLRSLSKGGAAKRSSVSAQHAPRFRRDGALTRMVNGGHHLGQRKSPGRGWLRGSRPGRGPVRSLASSGVSRRSPGRGWLRGSGGNLGSSSGVFRRSGGLGGKSALGGKSPKSPFGKKSRPSRIRMGRTKKNWRRTGGYR
jgi:rod shape-determining protein MreD